MNRFLRVALPALVLCTSVRALADSASGVQTRPVNEPARWALGLTLGEPTGISAKRYLGGRNSFDLNIDAAYGPGLRIGADYLWGLAQLLSDRSSVDLDVYLGVGPFVGTLQGPCENFGTWRHDCNGDLYAGGRMPLGIEAVFQRVPVTLGLELAPGLAFAPGRAGFLLDASLMARVLL